MYTNQGFNINKTGIGKQEPYKPKPVTSGGRKGSLVQPVLQIKSQIHSKPLCVCGGYLSSRELRIIGQRSNQTLGSVGEGKVPHN